MNPLDLRKSDGAHADYGAEEPQQLTEPISIETTTQNLENVRARLMNLVNRFWELDVALIGLRGLWVRMQADAFGEGQGMAQMPSAYPTLGKLPTIPEEDEEEIHEGDS